jgi:hypothetical protein
MRAARADRSSRPPLSRDLIPALRHYGAATMLPRPVAREIDLDPTP